MNRNTENVVLFLLGMCTAAIVVTGTFTRYVKPTLMPWLAMTAVLLILLALSAAFRDFRARGRRGDDADHPDDAGRHEGDNEHAHRSGVVWVLAVALLGLVVPPALGARAPEPSVTELPRMVLLRPFPPLPAGRAPELPLPEVVVRVNRDSALTLEGRLITVTGFTIKDGDRIDLGRVVISCCAADGQLARLHLRGPAAATAATYPEETWLRVEGTVVPKPYDMAGLSTPTLTVSAVTPIEAPQNPYEY